MSEFNSVTQQPIEEKDNPVQASNTIRMMYYLHTIRIHSSAESVSVTTFIYVPGHVNII